MQKEPKPLYPKYLSVTFKKMFRNISDSNTFGVISVSRQTAVLHVNLKWYKIYFGGKINLKRPEPIYDIYLFHLI